MASPPPQYKPLAISRVVLSQSKEDFDVSANDEVVDDQDEGRWQVKDGEEPWRIEYEYSSDKDMVKKTAPNAEIYCEGDSSFGTTAEGEAASDAVPAPAFRCMAESGGGRYPHSGLGVERDLHGENKLSQGQDGAPENQGFHAVAAARSWEDFFAWLALPMGILIGGVTVLVWLNLVYEPWWRIAMTH